MRDPQRRCRAVLAFGGSGCLKPRAGEHLRARAAHQPLLASASCFSPSRVASTSKRNSRKGWRLLWCSVRRFHSPATNTWRSSFTASMESNAGSSPPHSPLTVSIGEAFITGEAMLPRNRVRTSRGMASGSCSVSASR